MLSFTMTKAQIRNAQTESAMIYGNCEICERSIEKAGSVKRIASVDWDKDTKEAVLTYDTSKTNRDEILKRIALAGYDSDQFLAPDEVYSQLPECCQYERINKTEAISTESSEDHSMHNHGESTIPPTEMEKEANHLEAVFGNYFALKDALVESDAELVAAGAKELLHALNAVQMNTLSEQEHRVWMEVMKELTDDTKHIGESFDVGHQRDNFRSLSDRMYQLIKVSAQDTPTYYQHCPMANDGKGANWLSKEEVIRNPYYGSAMLSCGQIIETIE